VQQLKKSVRHLRIAGDGGMVNAKCLEKSERVAIIVAATSNFKDRATFKAPRIIILENGERADRIHLFATVNPPSGTPPRGITVTLSASFKMKACNLLVDLELTADGEAICIGYSDVLDFKEVRKFRSSMSWEIREELRHKRDEIIGGRAHKHFNFSEDSSDASVSHLLQIDSLLSLFAQKSLLEKFHGAAPKPRFVQ
jgi:hypothetical protein